MAILPEIGQKIKALSSGWGRVSEWLLAASIVCIALISFFLGRLSVGGEERPAVPTVGPIEATEGVLSASGGQVVASRSGTAYHLPWCPGAAQIAERNKVWFESVEAARVAGYSPAKNCKGLE